MIGPWEVDRGPQFFAYDVWWHLRHDTLVTSEWATPSMLENGLNPEDLLGRKFGHHLNFWNMSERKLIQRIDLGDQHQMVLELRPPTTRQDLGFVGVVISVEDLSASVWLWHKAGDQWAVDKVITIPAEPADPTCCHRPAAVRCGATAGLGHRSLRRRPVAVRILLGDR
ncbi:56kDa selenium binding family protein [Mycobacterium xenopi 4042]|uniref:56kDa selenium binding family protein n=1 Tax=Mycobacterium xenopi 4042 TaxID=1299334 RepID=X8C7X7_MYCXE|nr:56kDa selenium binding family protein [Mycobacterium xenopi 4042]